MPVVSRSIYYFLFFVVFVLVSCSPTSTEPLFNEAVLFQNGTDGYECYRIPAIIKAPSGDLLALAEGRKENCHDFGDVDIVYKISEDNGATWSSLMLLADYDTLQVGNPGPVVVDSKDGNNAKLMLFYNSGIASEQETRLGNGLREVWFKTSEDNGKTWSASKNITQQVNKPNRPDLNPDYNFEEDWRSYAITPGHCIQLKKGKYAGRIIVSANHSAGEPKDKFDEYQAHCFYSDDGGESFQLSESVPIPSSNEAIAVELSDGTLMMNIREQSGRTKTRLVAISENGGESWSKTYFDNTLITPVCQASILSYMTACDKEILIFSNPASQSKRERMTVRISVDDGQSWASDKVITEGNAAYSDLVQQQDNRVGLLYEKGNGGGIYFANFNLEYLLENHQAVLKEVACQ